MSVGVNYSFSTKQSPTSIFIHCYKYARLCYSNEEPTVAPEAPRWSDLVNYLRIPDDETRGFAPQNERKKCYKYLICFAAVAGIIGLFGVGAVFLF